MQIPNFSQSTVVHETGPQSTSGPHKGQNGKPGIAFAGILLGYPVAMIAMIGLLFAGRPLLETALVGFGLQILAFAVVLAVVLLRPQTGDLSSPAAADIRIAPRKPVDTWRVYPGSGQRDGEFRTALISPDGRESRDIAVNLAGLGREVHHSTDRDALLGTVQARPEKWNLVVFDLDSAPDLDAGIEDLLDFRTVCPDLPVLLLSGGTLRNDFSPHRRVIADATLRKPVSRRRLIDGLDANNLNFAAGH